MSVGCVIPPPGCTGKLTQLCRNHTFAEFRRIKSSIKPTADITKCQCEVCQGGDVLCGSELHARTDSILDTIQLSGLRCRRARTGNADHHRPVAVVD